jgi:thioredoxin reductase
VTSASHTDVVVVGGGPAGLEAGLLLARACLSVRVLDAGRDDPAARRNAATHLAHGTIGLDGIPPSELRRRAIADLARYGVTVEHGEVRAIVRDGARLRVERVEGAPIHARRVLLATGIEDVLPDDLPGLRETWGATTFSCPYCHGFELASAEGAPRRWGLLAHEVAALKMAPLYTRWSRALVILTDGGEPPPELRAAHEKAGLPYDLRPIVALEHEGDALRAVVFEDGESLPLDALIYRPPRRPAPLVTALGLALDEHGLIAVDHRTETSLKGVHACGDATTTPHQIVFAMSDGGRAAMAIASSLAFEDVLG